MRATTFEFRYRVVIIALLFTAGFSCSAFDRVTAAGALANAISPGHVTLNSAQRQSRLRTVFGVGALVIAVGAMLRTWGAAYLQSEVVHDASVRTEGLVADGPYRFVRNPLYLGTLLMTMGLGLIASRTGWLVLVAGILLFEYRLMFREEAELVRTLGERYRAYCAAVPRFWPALRARVHAGNTPPRWRQAVVGEVTMWMFALALGIFAVTLNSRYLWWIIASGAILGLVIVPWWYRHEKAEGDQISSLAEKET